jgi:hypothetical protein
VPTHLAIGAAGELLVASMFALNGYQVYRPLADDRGVDLVVDVGGGRHVMVQVKSIRTTSSYVFMPKTGFALEPWVALALVVMAPQSSLDVPIYLIPAENWRQPTPPFISRDYGEGMKSKPEYGLNIRKNWQQELDPWKATPGHVAAVLSASIL